MKLLNRRRFQFSSEEQRYYPYQRVEYLEVNENTGSPYIDTKYIPQGENIVTVCSFEILNYPNNTQWIDIWNAYQGESYQAYRCIRNIENGLLLFYNGGRASTNGGATPVEYNKKFNVMLVGPAYTNVNGSAKTRTGVDLKGTTNQIGNLTIFPKRFKNCYCRFYYFRMYKAGEPVFDLIPVRINDIGYMYDKISNNLFANAGSLGKFKIGPDIENKFEGFAIIGKFIDNSTQENWYCTIDNKIVDLSSFVNTESKRFVYWQNEKPISLKSMFEANAYIESIEFKGIDNVTNMASMFRQCYSLTTVLFDKNECVTNLSVLFYNCSSLKEVDMTMIDTKNVVLWNQMFSACYGFKKLIANFDFNSATNVNNMFPNSSALSDVIGEFTNIKISPYTRALPLTNDSAMVFINGLSQVENQQTITFSKTTYDTLTEEQIKIANDKNWVVTYPQ